MANTWPTATRRTRSGTQDRAPVPARAFGDAGDTQDMAATPLGTVPTGVRSAVTQSADHRLKIHP